MYSWAQNTAVSSGSAASFAQLAAYRFGVGIGEAGCTPPANSLIADYYPPKSRSTALGFYAMGVTLGGMLANLIGGPITDGLGFSLVVADEGAEPDLWNSKDQWRASGRLGGSPSMDDPAPPAFARVVINEALTRSDAPPPTDTIELLNPTPGTADVSGWFLSHAR